MRLFIFISFLIIAAHLASCKKYLDEKPNQKFTTINSLEDLQALLDANGSVNEWDPLVGEASSDNYFLTLANYNGLPNENDRNLYIWEKNIFLPTGFNDWSRLYDNVYRANTIIENIEKFERTLTNKTQWDNIIGQAYFLRGKSFLKAVEIWSLVYDANTANSDLGIPLRLNTNFNEISVRSSVQQSYDQAIQDLRIGVSLLPNTPLHVMRASKPTGYAILARAYLDMRHYLEAGAYADSCLQIYNTLYDYNLLVNSNPTAYLIPQFNQEVIYHTIGFINHLYNQRCWIDSALYNSYNNDDLRKTFFFYNNPDGSKSFRGSYNQNFQLFNGVATDEVFLIRAECYARAGNKDAALSDLNALMKKRWKASAWIPFTASDAVDALNKVLIERRKELLMRGLRWIDIKRLNKEGANISLTRILNNQTYAVTPGDKRFALPLPENVITISGMQQNPRN